MIDSFLFTVRAIRGFGTRRVSPKVHFDEIETFGRERLVEFDNVVAVENRWREFFMCAPTVEVLRPCPPLITMSLDGVARAVVAVEMGSPDLTRSPPLKFHDGDLIN